MTKNLKKIKASANAVQRIVVGYKDYTYSAFQKGGGLNRVAPAWPLGQPAAMVGVAPCEECRNRAELGP